MTQIVIPGEEVSLNIVGNVIKEGNKKIVTATGLLNDKRIIPLTSVYTPREGDVVLGIIISIKHKGYVVSLNGPYDAYLNSMRNYRLYDIVSAKVMEVSETKHVTLSFERGLRDGELVTTMPSRIPRIIGKAGSMLKLITSLTNTRITVGKNGLVWIQGEKKNKVKEVIKLIEKQAHKTGLTDKVKEFLEKK